MKKYKLIKEYPGSPKLGTEGFAEEGFTKWKEGKTIKVQSTNTLFDKYPEYWQEVVEKEWEILSFKHNDTGNIWKLNPLGSKYYWGTISLGFPPEKLIKDVSYSIHSVKRLSDGEVFTIGDAIGDGIILIHYFKIKDNKMMLSCSYSDYSLVDIYKVKKAKKPLFTTEDGVDIFSEKQDVYYVNPNYGNNIWTTNKFLETSYRYVDTHYKHLLFFSTKEAAETYILENKPCLSYKDIVDNSLHQQTVFLPNLKELIKNKLNL